MKVTIIEPIAQSEGPKKLTYSDMIRITGIDSCYYNNGSYFIIAQVGFSMMTLFSVDSSTPDMFNRAFDPVEVDWPCLDTNTIKNYLPWKCGKIEKVTAELTITIKGNDEKENTK